MRYNFCHNILQIFRISEKTHLRVSVKNAGVKMGRLKKVMIHKPEITILRISGLTVIQIMV